MYVYVSDFYFFLYDVLIELQSFEENYVFYTMFKLILIEIWKKTLN